MTAMTALADLVLGAACVACHNPGSTLCLRCHAELVGSTPQIVSRSVDGMPPTLASGLYEGPRRACIIALKERGAWSLVAPMAMALTFPAGVFLNVLPGPITLVPVPSSARAVRERGADTLLMVARACAAQLRRAGAQVVVEPLLVQRTVGHDQGGLTAADRRRNMRGRCAARRIPQGDRLLLIDDVVTTGATLVEAQRALAAAGCPALGAVTLAAAGWR